MHTPTLAAAYARCAALAKGGVILAASAPRTCLREAEAASLRRRQGGALPAKDEDHERAGGPRSGYERSRMSENFIFGDFSAM
jgi:hypothetical protein